MINVHSFLADWSSFTLHSHPSKICYFGNLWFIHLVCSLFDWAFDFQWSIDRFLPEDLYCSHLCSTLKASAIVEVKIVTIHNLRFPIHGIKLILIFHFSFFQFILIEICLIFGTLWSIIHVYFVFVYVNFQMTTFNLLTYLLKSQFHFKENLFTLDNFNTQIEIVFLNFWIIFHVILFNQGFPI